LTTGSSSASIRKGRKRSALLPEEPPRHGPSVEGREKIEPDMNTQRLAKLELSAPRLAADLATAKGFAYHDAYSEYVCGRWPTCMLWNRTGTVEEQFVSEYDGPARKTSYGKALPYISELIEQVFDLKNLRFARLVQLTPNTVIIPHRDFVELGNNFCRVHVPLLTNESCWNSEGDVVFHMPAGEVWFLDASVPHSAASFWDEVRTHIMLDFAHEGDPRQLLRIDTCPDQTIPPERIVTRPPISPEEEEALRSLHRLIDLDNYRDVLALLIRKYFRRQVPVAAVFDWMFDIAALSGNQALSERIFQLRERCLIHRTTG
jgi:hypothetical protein